MYIRNETAEMLNRALLYIRSQAQNPALSSREIAAHIGYCNDYFNRIFTSYTGYRVMEYVRFFRLWSTATELRTRDSDISDLAQACGYTSPESFTRAFRKQFGMAPSEYRKKMRETVMTWGDYGADSTVGSRFASLYPELISVPQDDAIRFLHRLDSIRFRYDTADLQWMNGNIFIEQGIKGASPAEMLEEKRDFISANGDLEGRMYFYLFLSHPEKLGKYLRLIAPFSLSAPSAVSFASSVTEEQIRSILSGTGLQPTTLHAVPAAIYTGSLAAPVLPEDFTVHMLTAEDLPAVQVWKDQVQTTTSMKLCWELQLSPSLVVFHTLGLFRGRELIGAARLCLMETHGLKLNNCISMDLLPEYRNAKMYRLLYRLGTKYALDHGYLPYDDMQYGENALAREGFTSAELGYRQIHTYWRIAVRENISG